MANWQAFTDEWTQTSFPYPVPAPNAEPDAGDTVRVCFNRAWLPYVLGALYQLTQPAAWDPASAGYADVLGQAQTLMAMFAEAAGGCGSMIRLTDGCELQYSDDGGSTWTTAAGWDSEAQFCFAGPPGAPGGTGPIGPAGPGVPPIQPGQSTANLACSVAGYIAEQWIQASIASVVSSITHGDTVLEATTALFSLVPEIGWFIALVTNAGKALYDIINSGTLSDFNDASTDPLLLSDLTCAIYEATSTDGYVTSGNFAAVITAISGITYTHPDVISAIVTYLSTGGVNLLANVQIPGALAVVDCSGCSGAPENALEFNPALPNVITMNSDTSFGTADFSIFMWVYLNSTSNQTLWQSGFGAGDGFKRLIQLILFGGHLFSDLRDSSGADNNVEATGVTLGGIPLLIVLTRSGGTQTLYVNNNSPFVGSCPTGTMESTGAAFTIGDGTSGPSDMTLASYGLANGTAWSATQVNNFYVAGPKSAPPSGATSWWKMNEGAGNTLADSLAGNDGTLSGTATWVVFP